jgi:cytochrome c oxidase assembly factor CtaG
MLVVRHSLGFLTSADVLAPFSWRHLSQWKIQWVPMIMIVVAGALYFALARRASSWPLRRSIMFGVGLFVTTLATQSIVGVYDRTLFADHMIQHLMLIMIAAPLFALSAPLDLLRTCGEWANGLLDSAPAKVILHPLVAFGIYATFIPISHLSGLFNLALHHELVHDNEHLLFIIVGYLFFRQAFGIEQDVHLNPGLRLVYLMVAVPVDTFTGLALAMLSRNPFSGYAHQGRSAQAVLSDLHLGGAIMWIGGDALMLLALIPITVTWVKFETARTKLVDAQLDELGI